MFSGTIEQWQYCLISLSFWRFLFIVNLVLIVFRKWFMTHTTSYLPRDLILFLLKISVRWSTYHHVVLQNKIPRWELSSCIPVKVWDNAILTVDSPECLTVRLTVRSQCKIVPWVSCVVDEWLQNELAVSFHVSLHCVSCELKFFTRRGVGEWRMEGKGHRCITLL